ncbi:acyltransferase family protein [Nitrospirillum sp. BR 11163]|uniref:acyltransferase family protein n=1 Tax=Nitrospirillum sp. BR 11163 TaxID=3104323 RepID=UPI002AFDDCE0|nr:acyltransferase family protein [Nitrospirillum sp. BR 11163]MEA1677219.1 acyltransferase family protein [Nitrospirillum sp. BR 11163]
MGYASDSVFFGLRAAILSNVNHGSLVNPKYRSDIDGLRAIAVLSVILFHAFPNALRGGFVGVDIFFVISGFLISTIIIGSFEKDRFSFIHFYERRIRRIFPALLLVLISCFVMGWIELFPDEYKQLGKHISASAVFVMNLFLIKESGYFDNAVNTKPLLHIWSLGVEEQFYIAWPLILWVVYKFRINIIAAVVFFVGVSFTLNVDNISSNSVSTFYSPQTRAWELLVGAVLAHIILHGAHAVVDGPSKARIPVSATARNILSIVGILLVVAGFLVIDGGRKFPGWWAVMPVAGTFLMIFAGPGAWLNRMVLGRRLMVWFGTISFPLYLWHWPLLVFARIVGDETPPPLVRAGVLLGAILLAWLTYRLVERPFRFGGHGHRKAIVLMLLMGVVAVGGYDTWKRDGLTFRPISKRAEILSHYDNRFGDMAKEDFRCFFYSEPASTYAEHGCDREDFPGKPTVFVAGNSFSAYLSQALRPLVAAKGLNFVQYSAAFCNVLLLNDKRERCRDISSLILARIKEEKPDTVILFANYAIPGTSPEYGDDVPYDEVILRRTEEIREAGVRKVIVLGMIPTWESDLPKVLLRRFVAKRQNIPARTYDGINKQSFEWDEKLRSKKYPDGVIYVSLKDALCNEQGCLAVVGPDLKTDVLQFDYGHLTKAGAGYIVRNIVSQYLN